MNALTKKSLYSFTCAVEANYYVALLVSLGVAILGFTSRQDILGFSEFGLNPLVNNLKLMLVYLVLAEYALFLYCFMKQSYKELLLAGLFLLSLIGGLEFYGSINQVYIDPNLQIFFLYIGLSHLANGCVFVFSKQKNRLNKDMSELV